MAIPAFLASSYYFFERSNVTDVQTVIDDFEDEVLANDPVWTTPSAGVYVSPVDGYGRFMQVELTRVDAQTLSAVIKDQNGITISTRRIVMASANGNHVRIFTGQYHFAIDCYPGPAAPEFICGGILDISPEAQNAHARYVWAGGPRNSAGTYTSYYWEYYSMLDNATPAIFRRANIFSAPISGYPIPSIDSMGYWVSQPIMMYVFRDATAFQYYAGRSYQMVFICRLAGSPGTEITLPVDAGVTGVFKILSGPGYSTDPEFGWVVAVRVA